MTNNRDNSTPQPQWLKSLSYLLFGLTILINGCTTPPPTKQPEPLADIDPFSGSLTVEQILKIAANTRSPDREELILQASSQALQDGFPDKSKRILTYIAYQKADYTTKSRFIAQLARIALYDHDAFTAIRIFEDPRYALSSFYSSLSIGDQATLSRLRSQAFELAGNPIAAIMERVHLTELLLAIEKAQPASLTPLPEAPHPIMANNDAIWYNFMSLSPELYSEIGDNLAQEQSPSQIILGWLALANINQTFSGNLTLRLSEVMRWQREWASHPAARFLPTDLTALMEATKLRPEHIAVIVPQSGKLKRASDVMVSGFMSAYYYAQSQQATTPQINFYDSEQGNIIDIYNQAVANGAQMVIGPLDKERVNTLNGYGHLEVPTIALNYVTNSDQIANNLFQFGLAAEDEVAQIADRALLENHRYAAIMYPDNAWGKRVSASFKQYWESLSGHLAAEGIYKGNGDFSATIQEMLLINQSKTRSREMRQLLGGDVESSPRRRQDVDFIVVLGGPKEARQIVPTLAFHYAQDIPVYSTSNTYAGRPNPAADKDLNGVTFIDLPWVLSDEDPVKLYLRQQIPSSPRSLSRLQAMGADAYRLHQQLAVLTLSPGANIKGSTGQLSIGEQQRIKRRSLWAKFKNGQANIDNSAPLLNESSSHVTPSEQNHTIKQPLPPRGQ